MDQRSVPLGPHSPPAARLAAASPACTLNVVLPLLFVLETACPAGIRSSAGAAVGPLASLFDRHPMARVTADLLRSRAEHNDRNLITLQEIALHAQGIERIELLSVASCCSKTTSSPASRACTASRCGGGSVLGGRRAAPLPRAGRRSARRRKPCKPCKPCIESKMVSVSPSLLVGFLAIALLHRVLSIAASGFHAGTSLAAAAGPPVVGPPPCPCADPSLCQPLTAVHNREVFGFSIVRQAPYDRWAQAGRGA